MEGYAKDAAYMPSPKFPLSVVNSLGQFSEILIEISDNNQPLCFLIIIPNIRVLHLRAIGPPVSIF